MRATVRLSIRFIFLFLSLDFIFLLVDTYERLEWAERMISMHPLLEQIVRGPLTPLVCLILCIGVVYGDKLLKRPDLKAEYLRFEIFPKIESVKLEDIDKESYAVDADI